MTPDALKRIAADFWRRAADVLGDDAGPHDVRSAVEAALPVNVVELGDITPGGIGRWLRERGVPNGLEGDDALRGCLFARRRTAFLFVRSDDDPAEQRFTLAHEAAHFLLHHEAVRDDAPAAVLDGDRPATEVERLGGALVGRPVRPHVHLYGSDEETSAENDADALAVELLAPELERRDFETPEGAAAYFTVPARALTSAMRPAHRDPLVEWARDVLTEGRR